MQDTTQREQLPLHRALRIGDGRNVGPLAGVPEGRLAVLQRADLLPEALEDLIRIAIAKGKRVEDLVAQDVLDELRADIEARRLESTMENDHASGCEPSW